MAGNVSDEAFARAVQQAGIATFDEIEAGRAAQAESAKKNVTVSLADVLVQQGVINAKQREGIEKKLQADQQTGGIKQLGPYKLLKKLGEGGMGAVYLADDTSVGRKVAVKVLPKKYSEEREFLTRFRREAQATGRLNHVNIVMAYNVGEDAGTHYYAMEYCEGETLDQILKRDKVIPWDAAVGVVLQVARGLTHAHDHGIIHRDIKPANIFICKPLGPSRDREGAVGPLADARGSEDLFAEGFVAKILDLGLSKNIEGGEQSFYTQTGVALGTPHYISPEQAKGEKGIDGRTDIYSLGATFYHLVTGQTPFQGSTAALIMMKHLNDQLPNPQDINPDIPDGVAQVIARMMAKEPNDRYANCKELLDDLELVIDGKMPSSQAIDVGKSSVAVARRVVAAGGGMGRRGDGGKRLATRQQQPVAHFAKLREPGAREDRTQSRKMRCIAAGVLGLGAITFIAALAFSGKQDADKSDATKAAPDARTVTPDAGTAKVEPVAAKAEALPKELSLDLGGGVKMELVLIKAGEFMMGSPDNEGGNEEKPAHKVKISKPFYMGKYHVTVAQFRAFVDATKHVTEAEKAGNKGYTWDNGWKELGGVNWMKPNFPQEDNHPVCLVTWNDAQEFCKWAAKKTGRNACLPTEAQWEYACRAGTTTKFNTGDKDSDLEQAGWFSKNSGTRTHPVGQRKPDAWGLYDMHGNVWEWVQDYFNDNYYAESPPVDPKGPTSGGNRVLRGGSWDAGPDHCRAAHRDRGDPGCRATKLGFRLALDVSEGGVPITVQPQTTNQKPETGVTDAWIKMVQAQPAEKQVEEVVKKLKELNPGYDGKVEPKINDANVAGLSLTPGPLRDISPLRALAKLEELGFGDWAVSKPLADLRPLNGLMLRALDIRGTKVHDLVPLKEMPLRFLYMTQTPVSDLSPLANMPLTELSVDVTSVTDLSPIRKLRLTALFMAHTKISDLEPVRGMPLSVLTCSDTKVMTLAPLIASPLKRLHCDFKPDRDAAILRSIKTLEIINYLPVAEFWKKYPEAGTAKPDAGAERAWKPIFDGKTLECLDEGGKEAWRVENGVLTNTPGKASCGTKAQFGDGDVRVCFEVIGNAWVEMKMYRPGPPAESTYMVAPVPKGARELIFSRRGNQVSASVDGQATEVKTFGPPTNQGGLVFFVDKGALRVKSIEYRELAPERLEVGQKDKDGWTCIFNGRDLTGWEVNGKPKVEDAAIVLPEGSETVRRTDKADFELRGSVKAVSGRLFCGVLAFRLGRDPLPRLSFCTDGDVHFWEAGATPLAKSGPGRVPVGVWRSFALRVVGTSVSVEVESKPAVKATVARQDATGLALQAWAGDGRAIAFKDLWLRELGPDGKPLGAAPKP